MDCVFIGYAYNNSAYEFFIHKLSIENIHYNTIIESKSTIFFEDVFSFEELQENYSLKRMIEANSNSHYQSKNDEVEPKRSKRTKALE